MKKSIFSKIFGGYLLVILLLVVLVSLFSYTTIRTHYIDTLAGSLNNQSIILQERVKPLLKSKQYAKLESLLVDLCEKTGTRITVIDKKGLVLAESEKDPKFMENHSNRPEVIQAMNGKIGRALRYSSTLKQEMLYIAMPITENKNIIAVVRTSLPLKEIQSLLSKLQIKIFVILIIITGIAILLAFLFSRKFAGSVKDLAVAYREAAKGNFDARIYLKEKDELKELADGFNNMSLQIKESFSELSRQKEELAALIESIQEGFLVLDNKDRIILSNTGFKKIIDITDIEGKSLSELTREAHLNEIVKNTRNNKKFISEELDLQGRHFLCSCAYLTSTDRVVILLHDITEIKNLEKIKKDFVLNVSHELRTPLTAIKGFVETLEGETAGENKHYLEIINRHTDRLINIVEDLLKLSVLEEPEIKLKEDRVDLKNILGSTAKIFEKKLKEKNLILDMEIADIPFFKADPFKLEQVFINLIDNAIKYTEKGHIKISAIKKDNNIAISVEDTGIGIPSDSIDRIFERFYVVDKSRSRNIGGTGLGLSIVKHIVQLHKGKIEVQSSLGKGTTFLITLPFIPA